MELMSSGGVRSGVDPKCCSEVCRGRRPGLCICRCTSDRKFGFLVCSLRVRYLGSADEMPSILNDGRRNPISFLREKPPFPSLSCLNDPNDVLLRKRGDSEVRRLRAAVLLILPSFADGTVRLSSCKVS